MSTFPNQETNEVEIARIEIDSTTFDVTSVYARRDASAIHYRVVDDYDGDTLSGPNTRQSAEPLTLGELEDFFTGAWPLQEVLEIISMTTSMRCWGSFAPRRSSTPISTVCYVSVSWRATPPRTRTTSQRTRGESSVVEGDASAQAGSC